MRHCRGVVFAMVAVLSSSAPAAASAQLALTRACATENAQISINFNGMDSAVTTVKSKLDARIAEATGLAEDEHFTKFDIQSYSYNISATSNGTYGGEQRFQYSGSASFSVLPADKAVDFMAHLVRKGYQASVNVSGYNNANCSPRTLR